jgi:superfamily II DNA or RNA helicase
MSFTYIGTSEHCKGDSKIGKSSNLYSRENSLESSYSRFAFLFKILIICSCDGQALEIEEYLHKKNWDNSTTRFPNSEGGVEWFDKQFMKEEIKHQLLQGGYENEVIDDPLLINNKIEPLKLKYEKRKQKYIQKMNSNYKPNTLIMRPYQLGEHIISWFNKENKGILNWCCGLGKTIEALYLSTFNFKKYMLVGVNNISLFGQWIKAIKLFYKHPILCICSRNIDGQDSTLDINKIKQWLYNNPRGVILTTYRSSYKLLQLGISFDFGILDECHHLCNVKNYVKDGDVNDIDIVEELSGSHRNIDILQLDMKKQLGLTATMKEIDTDNEKIDNIDEDTFGKIIDQKSILWGIENNYLCDYFLSVPKITAQELEELIDNKGISKDDYYLYLSAYISLNSLTNGTRKKMLIFVNRINDIETIYSFIIQLIRSYQAFHSFNTNTIFRVVDVIDGCKVDTNSIVEEFNQLSSGIMINCYKIGEGVDIPSLDSVLFADNMNSGIRIIQSALRPCRKDPDNPDKKAHIIVPMIYEHEDDQSYDDNDTIKTFDLLKQIIEEISISDENILQKVKPVKISSIPKKPGDICRYVETPEIEHSFKMKLIKRDMLGKKTFTTIKRILHKMGGRMDETNTFIKDYESKQGKHGLPDLEWMKGYLVKKDISWCELYDFNISIFISWEDFEKIYRNKYSEEDYEKACIINDNLPNLIDLEDVYPGKYKRLDFWDNSGYDMEF